ncbi:kinesin-like protein KIF12, partial [Biomphalaria pfeifferi]
MEEDYRIDLRNSYDSDSSESDTSLPYLHGSFTGQSRPSLTANDSVYSSFRGGLGAGPQTPPDLMALSAKRQILLKGNTGAQSKSNNGEKRFRHNNNLSEVLDVNQLNSEDTYANNRNQRQYAFSNHGNLVQPNANDSGRQQVHLDLAKELSSCDIESVYPGGDTYIFYMQTSLGEVIGPLRFDVEDVVMGLPIPVQQTEEFKNNEKTSSGLRNRQTGSHGLNEFSSRSHSVLTVTVDSETQPEPDDENLYVTKRGKLSFVDLAGSEKVRDSNMNAGPGMTESNSINKSLLVLGNCISHLCDPKKRQGHIPYRDSKLTKLLADSLGGNGISLMIACITPASSNVTETMNTLRYASRAKKIKTKPTIKMDPREKLIVSLKKEIKILRQENHYLRQQLDFPAKPRGQLQKENDEKFQQFMKEQHQKESGLYDMLQEYMVENENLRAENSEMHATKESSRREQQILYRENEKLLRRVEELE